MFQKNINRCDEFVTVIALCYNQSAFLKQTLNSIINQTWAPSHIYIIDDCSADDSVVKIKEWIAETNFNATLICHEKNRGVTRTMNEALELCTTKYFQPWPCDDLMVEDKIEAQVEYLESLDWEPGLLYGDIQWIDSDGIVFRDSVNVDRRKLFADNKMPSGNIFPQLIEFGCFIPTASGMYATAPLKKIGGFDEGLFAEDWDMFMRLALSSGIACYDRIFSQYRRHRDSMEMKQGQKYWEGHFKILPKFLGINKEYDKLIWKKIGNDAILAAKQGTTGMFKWAFKASLKTFNLKVLFSYFRIRVLG